MEQLMAQLGVLAVRAGALAATAVCIWQFFKVILAGKGAHTALMQACLTLLVAGVALAAIANPVETWSIFYLLGTAIYRSVYDAVQSALNTSGL